MPNIESIRILGIDTSLRSTGVGVVEVRGQLFRAIAYGRIRNKPTLSHSQCLKNIFNELSALIQTHRPDLATIEGAFFAKNAQTAMILGQARGAAITACAQAGIPLFEHSPRKVKQAVVGTGSAQKDQVAKMVMQMLSLTEQPQEDAADALALAICHAHHLALPSELRTKEI
jgi:crossover junction endodeoxyribonuclease RuvC